MSSAFLERARLEAERYGSDPWVFVRELLQNGRDAGATEVRFEVVEQSGEGGAEATVICRDDGEGMSFPHARRYLFALYASSKEGKRNQAGKFGVGFWSILRWGPTSIVIRSWPRQGGAPWGLELDGGLARAVAVEPPGAPGTEIVLRRPGGVDGLEHRIADAVWQSARFLARRDDHRVPMRMVVNGRIIQGEFALPAPSSSFQRGRVRGVVGLGSSPRVELFSRGLRVRSAASLSDLLSAAGRHSDWMRVQFPELPGGLAPQALLESPDLAVMLSRADTRDDRALQRLVRLGQRELERLIDRHVAATRPLNWWIRLRHWLGDRLRSVTPMRLALAAAFIGLLALGLVLGPLAEPVVQPADVPSEGLPVVQAPAITPRTAPPIEERASERGGAYDDPGRRYGGPTVDGFGPHLAEPLALRYRPAHRRLRFATLTFEQLAADGSPVGQPLARAARAYRPSRCTAGCTAVELVLRTQQPTVRLPLPTGHRVAGAVTLDGRPIRLAASDDGRPLLQLAGPSAGLLRYATAPAAAAPDPTRPRAFRLSPDLERRVQQLRPLPLARRVAALRELVRQRVRYDQSDAVVRAHRASIARGDGFITRTLAAGAGDCDVQNGLLTALLQAAGVRARLAVGYLGERGRVLPWVHAWVEYLAAGDRWLAVDASAGAAGHAELRAFDAPAVAAPLPVGSRPRGRFEPSPPEPVAPALEPVAPAPEPAAPALEPGAPPVADGRGRRAAAAEPSVTPPALPTWLRFIPLALLPLAAWLIARARTRRTFKLDLATDAGAEVAKLLRGVLQHPGAFGHLRALHHRPLLPLADGRMISLTRARELLGRGRLFVTRTRPPLVLRALRAGAAVLDAAAEEGRVVADALGAIDLDSWAGILDRGEVDPLLAAVNRTLRAQGESWAVKAAPDVPGGVAAIDLDSIGARLPDVQAERLVAVAADAAWLAHARGTFKRQPQAAVFLVFDHLAARLSLGPRSRGRLLGESARAALLESFAP